MKNNFRIEEFNNSYEFIQKCEPLLLASESFHNLKLGLSTAIKENILETSEPIFISVYENDSLVGCALRTNVDKPLAISQLSSAASDLLVSYLFNLKINLNGVVGEVITATNFKDQWCQKTRKISKLNIHLGVYEASEIKSPNEQGSLILGTKNERTIILKFVKGFTSDCFPNHIYDPEKDEKLCTRHINNKSLYLLKNKEYPCGEPA